MLTNTEVAHRKRSKVPTLGVAGEGLEQKQRRGRSFVVVVVVVVVAAIT